MIEKEDDDVNGIIKQIGVREDDAVHLREGNVSLILDRYDDIFSDFDPRAYSERAVSDDFLVECKRAVREKENEEFELRLLMPKNKRDLNQEISIKKRLKAHFIKHHKEKEDEIKKMRREGLLWVFLGIIINVVVVSGFLKVENSIFIAFLSILEVPSWFLIWEGLGKALIESRKKKSDLEFYKKMSKARIYFFNY